MNDLTLEQYCLDELPAGARSAVEAASVADPTVSQRIRDIREHTDRLRDTGTTRTLATRVMVATESRGPRSIPLRSMTAAAVAIAMIVLVPRALEWSRVAPVPQGSAGIDRVKGVPASLLVFRQVSGGSEQLDDHAPARSGDVLRLAYRASVDTYGAIVSIDGAGVVTRHLPVDGDTAIRLKPGAATPLDAAYELDDAPRWERFYLVTSAQPFALATLTAAAAQTAGSAQMSPPGELTLPTDMDQTSFLLRKTR